MRAGLSILILLFAPVFARAAETPIAPAPTRWVTDTAGFMSPEAARSLDARLQAYQGSTGHQIIVYIGRTTSGVPIEDWAVHAFEAWKIGRKGIDDGLVIFIMADDHKAHIEVGYGLEPQVTDAIASQVIGDIIVPRIQSGDRDGAVTAATDALVRVISGQGLASQPAATPRGPVRRSRPISTGQLIFFGILGILVLILAVTHPSLALFLLMNILSGDGRGGSDGGGGGGGFSGGGGRSGGGGASGSW
jgi:uncharacterized protein